MGNRFFPLDMSKDCIKADGSLIKETMPDLLRLNSTSNELWAKAFDGKLLELWVK